MSNQTDNELKRISRLGLPRTGIDAARFEDVYRHRTDFNNPHRVTAKQIGALPVVNGNVDVPGNLTVQGDLILYGDVLGFTGYSEQIIITIPSQQSIELSHTPRGIEYVTLSKNGQLLRRTIDYTLNGTTITLISNVERFDETDDVYAEYFY